LPPYMTETQLLDVPKSMPMTLAIVLIPLLQPHSAPFRGSRNVDFIRDIGGAEPTTRSAAAETYRGLRHRHAAVHVQRLAGHVSGFAAGKIDAGRADVLAAAHCSHWDARQDAGPRSEERRVGK